MAADALNCPNCGAGVAGDSVQCPFCLSRLKTIACPHCFKSMFVGAQFCDHCGKKVERVSVRDGEDIGDCPRCKMKLDLLQIGDVTLDECRKCGGLWSDGETFQTICSDREEQSAVLSYVGSRELNAEPLAQISYVPCPKCKQLMNRSNFARASGVIIDTCKQHGAWFDADELPKIIEFIQKGGMEIARQRERAEIADERDRLREEQRRMATFDQKFGLAGSFEKEEDTNIRSFIRNLLDQGG